MGLHHLILRALPVVVDYFGHGVAILRIEDCRLKQVPPGQLAETVVQLCPTVHDAGHSNGIDAGLRHFGNAFGFQVIDGQRAGRPTAGIQAIQLACFGVPVNGEKVAADSIGHGLGDAQDGIGGDGRIDGGSALLQNSCARLRRLDVAGGDDAVLRRNDGTPVRPILCWEASSGGCESDECECGPERNHLHCSPI